MRVRGTWFRVNTRLQAPLLRHLSLQPPPTEKHHLLTTVLTAVHIIGTSCRWTWRQRRRLHACARITTGTDEGSRVLCTAFVMAKEFWKLERCVCAVFSDRSLCGFISSKHSIFRTFRHLGKLKKSIKLILRTWIEQNAASVVGKDI